ncbi:hypothetical protein OG458_42990 (plasmid) [Streptomyces sp. NBC_01281]|uniref:hypothetical protein n=1 Tax=Streptomyces sp. NBC_01281 TaxID=2903811 RepID=UPI002E141022|nr:hypothetical protein OG458_42990 [Streptomyces sp. NBC_01281]
MNERTTRQGHRSDALAAETPFLAAVGTAPQPVEPEPFFELRFAELRITLQRPPYKLMGALVTGAGAVSVWFTR